MLQYWSLLGDRSPMNPTGAARWNESRWPEVRSVRPQRRQIIELTVYCSRSIWHLIRMRFDVPWNIVVDASTDRFHFARFVTCLNGKFDTKVAVTGAVYSAYLSTVGWRQINEVVVALLRGVCQSCIRLHVPDIFAPTGEQRHQLKQNSPITYSVHVIFVSETMGQNCVSTPVRRRSLSFSPQFMDR